MTSNCATNILLAPMTLFAIHKCYIYFAASTTRIIYFINKILLEIRMLNITNLSTFQRMFGLIEDFLCRNANVFKKQNTMHVKSIDSKQQDFCDSFEFLAKF